MKENLPSFGELLDSLREVDVDEPQVAPLSGRPQLRIAKPNWSPPMSSSGVSIVISPVGPEGRSPSQGNYPTSSNVPRRSRNARYQPYSSGPTLSRRSSLPGEMDNEDGLRVASICSIKRYNSTYFERRLSKQPMTIATPIAPPISSLLRRSSPKSPTSPHFSETTRPPSLGPVTIPTLPTLNFKLAPTPASHAPVPSLRPFDHRSHSRNSSRDSMASISSSAMSTSTDEGASFSLSSVSGGSQSSADSSVSPRLRGRPYRVWTASGYRYPPVAQK